MPNHEGLRAVHLGPVPALVPFPPPPPQTLLLLPQGLLPFTYAAEQPRLKAVAPTVNLAQQPEVVGLAFGHPLNTGPCLDYKGVTGRCDPP